jgi:putative peptidoglycan lipid II flippase
MFPFLFLISLAALAMGTLNSLGSFFVPAVAPAFSNLTFIVSAPFFVARFGVLGLAFSVLAGGSAHFISQWIWGRRIGATLLPERPDFSDPDLRRMMALFLPYAAGLSLNQINPVVSRMLGSFLEEGSISVLNYANRIIQLPLGLFVIAISQAVLPRLSRVEDPEEFASTIGEALRFALFIVLPASVGLIAISGPFVHLIFVRGAFGEYAWRATSWALTLSVLGLPGMACSTVVMRGLYALSMPRAAFVTTAFSVGSTALLSFLLMFPMGYGGLALAPSVAFSLSGFVGLWYIRKKLARPLSVVPVAWIVKSLLALASMGLVLFLYTFFLPYAPSAGLWKRAGWCMGVVAVGSAAYVAATLLLRFEEWCWIKGAVMKK